MHEEPLLTDLCSCTDVRQAVDTTGNLLYAVCQKVCQEAQHGHLAKNLFAECLEPNTRQTRGTRHNPYLPSAGARQTNGTRQNMDMPSASEWAHGKAGARARHARWPSRPFALPSASRLALGKMRFCRVSFPGTRQSPVLPKTNLWPTGESSPRPPAYQKPTLTIAP